MLMTLAFVDSDEEKLQKLLNMINKNYPWPRTNQSVILPMPVKSSFKRHMRGYRGSREEGQARGRGARRLENLNFLNLIRNYPKHALDSPHPLPPSAKLRHPSSWNNFLDPHMMLHVTVPVDLALLINHILVHFFISVLVLCT